MDNHQAELTARLSDLSLIVGYQPTGLSSNQEKEEKDFVEKVKQTVETEYWNVTGGKEGAEGDDSTQLKAEGRDEFRKIIDDLFL